MFAVQYRVVHVCVCVLHNTGASFLWVKTNKHTHPRGSASLTVMTSGKELRCTDKLLNMRWSVQETKKAEQPISGPSCFLFSC